MFDILYIEVNVCENRYWYYSRSIALRNLENQQKSLATIRYFSVGPFFANCKLQFLISSNFLILISLLRFHIQNV